jgi:hypothetical protein
LGSGNRGKYIVEGICKDKDNNFSFKVNVGGQRKNISKEELTKDDPNSLLYFYEKHIEFIKK